MRKNHPIFIVVHKLSVLESNNIGMKIFFIFLFLLATTGLSMAHAEPEFSLLTELTETEALDYVKANTTLTGDLTLLTATFPPEVPTILADLDYHINSRMTLAAALPGGTTLSILLSVNDGWAFQYVTDAPIPGQVFWVTELFDPVADAALFDDSYINRVEVYNISINGPGTNPEDFDTTVTIESIISKDGFGTNEVLAAREDIPVHIDADEDAALDWVQANTTLTGDLAELIATFPPADPGIPPVIVGEEYVIDSRMTLTDPLPTGTTITVYRDSVPVLSDITLDGAGPFWFTELFDPDATRADFDANYGGAIEVYNIIINGPGDNPLDFDTTLMVESVISKDSYATETVLAALSGIPVHIDADEDAALDWVQANTTLTGDLAELTASFPPADPGIPPVIVGEDYKIDSRMTLTDPLPEGTTINVIRDSVPVLSNITLEGIGPFWFTELFDPDASRAGFDANYGGAIEVYNIIINGPGDNPLDFDTTLMVESLISKDSYETETVLATLSGIPVHIDAATYDLNTSASVGGLITLPGETQTNHIYGSIVGISASAAAGYQFSEWSGDVDTIADPYATSTTIMMDGEKNLQANFILASHCLSVHPSHLEMLLAPDSAGSFELSIENSCEHGVEFILNERKTLLREDFEDGVIPKTTWVTKVGEKDNNDQFDWTIKDRHDSPLDVDEGRYSAWVAYDDSYYKDEWLLTPALNIDGLSNLNLSFRAYSDTNWEDATMRVWVTDLDGEPLTIEPLWDMQRDEIWGTMKYRSIFINLSAFINFEDIRIAWQYDGINGQNFGLDIIDIGYDSDVSWISSMVPIFGTISSGTAERILVNFSSDKLKGGDSFSAVVNIKNSICPVIPVPVRLQVGYPYYLPLILR